MHDKITKKTGVMAHEDTHYPLIKPCQTPSHGKKQFDYSEK